MIELKEAIGILLNASGIKGYERVPIDESLHRVLASDVISDTDMPAFTKSAMDGYACRTQDIHLPLSLIETIPAGIVPEKTVVKGTCAKIMTGAILPEGADCVIKVEDTAVENGKIKFTGNLKSNNIRLKGEEAKKGTLLLKSGTIIKPQHIPVLASVGDINPLVYMQPEVAVISNGSELVEPGDIPAGAQIRNTNALQTLNQLKYIGLTGKYLGIIRDNEEEMISAIIKAKSAFDVILITGGVSMGDFDYVPDAIRQAGFEILFHKINVKPGKPLLFAADGKSFCIGIPGNPVSSFVQFELLIKPFLLSMQGNTYVPRISGNIFGVNHKFQILQQPQFIPVKINSDNTAEPLPYKGSAHIASISQADGLIEIPAGTGEILKGENIHVRLF